MSKKLTTEEFIERSILVHGDKYNYSKSNYINAREKIIITCPVHGDFEQTASHHYGGHGCSKCGGSGHITKKELLKRFNKKHNNFYKYENMNYVKMTSKIIITCPIHGDFEQAPMQHSLGNGCHKCAKMKMKKTRMQHDTFIKKANLLHKSFYIYNNKYIKSKQKMIITCPVHGDFEQTPNNHLAGHGCSKCSFEKDMLSKRDYLMKASKIHNNKYKYNFNSEKIRTDEKITITCPIHGDFEQRLRYHLSGGGCDHCARLLNQKEKYKNKETILYYIYLPEYELYKIGITTQTIEKRFDRGVDKNINFDIITSKKFNNGLDALEIEQKILSYYKDYQYKGENILRGGNTELFTKDILKEFYGKINIA